MNEFTLQYLDRLAQRLGEGADPKPLQDAIQRVLFDLLDVVAKYPPSSEANQPGRISIATRKPMGYYERGRGWWYPIMRKPAPGAKRGKGVGVIAAPRIVAKSTGVAGYRLRPVSEALGRKWNAKTEASSTGIVATLQNTASYAKYVQGPKDVQSRLQAARGWQSVEDVVSAQVDDITRQVQEAITNFVFGNEAIGL